MSVIKQISVFNGSDWNTGDIGADASNIDISSSILGSSTNVQSALTTIGNKIGTTAIPSGLGTTITGAINTLNTKLITNGVGYLSNMTLYNCTGTITGTIVYALSGDGKTLLMYGRIRITNFVRTGNNPGIRGNLSKSFFKTTNFPIGFRGESPVEQITLNLSQNSSLISLITTESYSNAANGTLTLMIPCCYIRIE